MADVLDRTWILLTEPILFPTVLIVDYGPDDINDDVHQSDYEIASFSDARSGSVLLTAVRQFEYNQRKWTNSGFMEDGPALGISRV